MNDIKKNILVVADNIDLANFIKKSLEYLYPLEYNVVCIDYGIKCFEVLEKKHNIPDIILFDLPMSGVSAEILDCLKNVFPWKDIPIIFLSEQIDDNFIKRPFEINNLKIKIERILGQ